MTDDTRLEKRSTPMESHMILSKLIAARIAYGVDRAVQANAVSPVLVKVWELNQAAHLTWLQYVTNWQQKGATPDLDTGGIRDAAFAGIMSVVSPKYVPGFRHGRTASFALDSTAYTLDISNSETHQTVESSILDAYGDVVSSEHFTYSSSVPAKATVSSTGLVTPIAAGDTVITVTSSTDVSHTVAVTVQA